MKFAFVGGLILLVISTISLAQIRYAITNPISSVTTLIGIALEIGLITYIAYHYLSSEGERTNTFSLIGTKGGRATKRRSHLNHYRKNKRSSF